MVINLPQAVMLSGLLALNTINSGLVAQSTDITLRQNLATHSLPLNDRYPNDSVNEVFKDNILLNLAYLKGDLSSANHVDWNQITSPSHFQITLKPGETFAYHEGLLPSYNPTIIGASHFGAQDGYKTDGYLYGDGVCHLASLFNWVASDAGLTVNAPTNHDFMPIPDIPRKYGTAIFYSPGEGQTNARENLYITNNKNRDVHFIIDYNLNQVNISVTES